MQYSHTLKQLKVLENLRISIDKTTYENGFPEEVEYINEGKGSFSGCINNLKIFHQLKTSQAWFANRDLQAFKMQAYITSKLRYIHCIEVEPRGMTLEADYFYGLSSDHDPMIHWMMSLQPISLQGLKWINNPREHFFRHWQMTLALRGCWQPLRERAELFLSDIPAKMKKFAVDQRFYLGLSKGDQTVMQAALEELTSLRVAKIRNEVFELAFPSAFISSYATMYAKIAWRHGFKIRVDTALIPKEWLPVEPLPEYPDPYDFMRKYKINAD